MKKILRSAMALSLAGAACLSFVGCGNDGSKIEAANREAFGKVYAATSNYSANLAALEKNSTESKNFEEIFAYFYLQFHLFF